MNNGGRGLLVHLVGCQSRRK